jgi:putative nucleotidyltransferase with HDIG domain
MKSLPFYAQLYMWMLTTIAVVLVVLSVLRVDTNAIALWEALILAATIMLADIYPIHLPFESRVEATVSCALKTAAVILFGPSITVLITLVGTLAAEIILKRTWFKAMFNTSEMILTTACMAISYELFYDGITRNPFHSLQNGLALMVLLLVFLVVNMGLVSTMVSLATRVSLRHIVRSNLRDLFWTHLTVVPLGAAMAVLWKYGPWTMLGLVLPIVLVRQSYQFVSQLHRQTRDALISMADAIDQRDPSTAQHSQRVASIAEVLAIQMGLSPDQVETITMAGRLHDLGKIGMSNTLLYKPDRFTDAEQAEFRQHPSIGASLVRSFRSFPEVQTLILHHHERYDGKGYPIGLAGSAIPIGSRILAVADALDAMTSRRVYRPTVLLHEAVAELYRNRGTQFDPRVVDAVLQTLVRYPERLPWPRPAITDCLRLKDSYAQTGAASVSLV